MPREVFTWDILGMHFTTRMHHEHGQPAWVTQAYRLELHSQEAAVRIPPYHQQGGAGAGSHRFSRTGPRISVWLSFLRASSPKGLDDGFGQSFGFSGFDRFEVRRCVACLIGVHERKLPDATASMAASRTTANVAASRILGDLTG